MSAYYLTPSQQPQNQPLAGLIFQGSSAPQLYFTPQTKPQKVLSQQEQMREALSKINPSEATLARKY